MMPVGKLILILGLVVCLIPVAYAQQDEGVINLESTVIGNQEQPKVLYIVPWQGPREIDGLQQDINSQLQGVFAHVDRSEWQRQLQYLKKLNAGKKQTAIE